MLAAAQESHSSAWSSFLLMQLSGGSRLLTPNWETGFPGLVWEAQLPQASGQDTLQHDTDLKSESIFVLIFTEAALGLPWKVSCFWNKDQQVSLQWDKNRARLTSTTCQTINSAIGRNTKRIHCQICGRVIGAEVGRAGWSETGSATWRDDTSNEMRSTPG